MPAHVQDALEQLRKAREGEKRTEQYVVQEREQILKEVTEEEYQHIVQERRDEFIVGDRALGYADTGKEIWEDGQALKEHQLERQQRAAAAAEKSAASTKAVAKPSAKELAAERGHANLARSFQSGAHGGGAPAEGSVAAAQGTQKRKDLDDMLDFMCSQLDGPASKPARAQAEVPAKRKLEPTAPSNSTKKAFSQPPGPPVATPSGVVKPEEGSSAATPAVKQEPAESQPAPPEGNEMAAAVKCEVKDCLVAVKREVEDIPAAVPLIQVKRELEDTQEAVTGTTVKDVKREPTVKRQRGAIRVKTEVASQVEASAGTAGAQLQEWLQGGACGGVKVERDEEGSAAESQMQLSLEEDGGLWFFFVDAFEDDRASPPRVYLFGKVLATAQGKGSSYQSCCLVVENIERCVHLLLNVDDLENADAAAEVAREAEAEFDEICRARCPGVRKLRAKLKWRNYAFEKALPQGAGYLPFLKVVCDASGQMPPVGLRGRTFNQAFGVNTSMMERLLLTRRITGPSWIRLHPGSWKQDPARLSFCAVELRIIPASIFAPKKDEERRQLANMGMPATSPPLRVLSLSMQTFQSKAQEPHEPVAIACTLHPNFTIEATGSDSDSDLRRGMETWVGVRRFDTRPLPRDAERVLPQRGVEHFNSESAMLTAFLSMIQKFEPDVLVGYNAYGFDLEVLAARVQHLKLQTWQKLGRLRRFKERAPRIEGRQGAGFWVGNSITAGRLVCDLLLQARDLLPKLGSYDLPNITRQQLRIDSLQTVEPESLPRFYDTAASLVELVDLTLQSSLCIARLMHSLQIIPLSRQLTNLAGNLWNSSLQNRRAERNEMLLCHEFHRKKFVVPDREGALARKRRMQQLEDCATGGGFDDADGQDQDPAAAPSGRRGKAAYSGGMVLEPKVGLYDEFVMLLDFNSLYPSIIQEHNICFTTVERPDETQVPKCSTEADLLGQTHLPDGTVGEGVLPQVLRRLVENRREVKAAMKSERNAQRLQTLEIRQKALKLTANSMYGCLGFQNSRFYAKPLAALITAKGREALQNTINVVQQELQLDVVYGDTDSVFVNTKTAEYEQAVKAAQQIKGSVNKRYRRLEIEIDAVFVRLMLLKKKKYAAVKVVDWEKKVFEREFKGLDIVRRDWCQLAKDIGEQVLTRVLEEGNEESVHWVHSFLTDKAKEMDEKKVPLEKYVITKGLTKDPKDYPDAKNQPHVQVALRLLSRGKVVKPGQEIAYVICEATDGPKTSLAERARHPRELASDPSLRVDIEWYKKQQVHPLVARLLGPVGGTDPARIAECLGMDASRFAQAAAAKDAAEAGEADTAFVESAGADVSALFDRKVRYKDFQSTLPGVVCQKCKTQVTWKQMLQPVAWEADSLSALFRCSECNEPVDPRRAQNLLTLQLRKLLKDHCEGWVQCHDENYIEKTRRANRGKNLTSERMVHKELEYIQFLCESEEGYTGQDSRRCREAARGMGKTTQWLLDCSGYNWVDCGQVFGGIFGQTA